MDGVIGIIVHLLDIYKWIVIIRVLLSWINLDPYNPIVQFLRSITDPAIEGLRRFMPNLLWSTGVDFTPLVLIVLLQVAIMFFESIHF
jgi:YggT family protein